MSKHTDNSKRLVTVDTESSSSITAITNNKRLVTAETEISSYAAAEEKEWHLSVAQELRNHLIKQM